MRRLASELHTDRPVFTSAPLEYPINNFYSVSLPHGRESYKFIACGKREVGNLAVEQLFQVYEPPV